MSFTLDNRLDHSSLFIAERDEFQIRLVNDKRYIWLLMIPMLADIRELDDLAPKSQLALITYASQLSSQLKSSFQADKMNIATIGNIVSQFHLHIIARHTTDEAWPDPVWGRGTAIPYDEDEAQLLIVKLQTYINSLSH